MGGNVAQLPRQALLSPRRQKVSTKLRRGSLFAAAVSYRTPFSFGERNICRAITPLLHLGTNVLCVPWLMDLRLRNWAEQVKEHYCPRGVLAILRGLRAQMRRRRRIAT